ncbi:muconolactone Delta-isomerase family protein [Amycolatopsis samaneae]|uniref:muconolactone Delta-isomerase family protein n=1 Tax=Amycolatopsis samaneae TaxID=664691 RepID=UPI003CD093D9
MLSPRWTRACAWRRDQVSRAWIPQAGADGLEEALTSLPIRPYVDIDVTPLATHPMMRESA